MTKFIWNEKEQTYFQKNYLKGWCVSIGISPYGKSPEYQVSDGIERTTSYDFYCLDEALEECARLNKIWKEEA